MNSRDKERIWDHIGTVEKHVAALAADMSWVKRFQWAIFGTSITAVVLIIIKTIIGG